MRVLQTINPVSVSQCTENALLKSSASQASSKDALQDGGVDSYLVSYSMTIEVIELRSQVQKLEKTQQQVVVFYFSPS